MENNEHFLKWITVEEFKCFSNFHAEGFKRVNLIGGKNNVGKTALMEAICINISSKDFSTMTTAIHNVKLGRESININYSSIEDEEGDNISIDFLENTKIYKSKSNVVNSAFLIKQNNGIKEYISEINEHLIKVNAKDFSYNHIFPDGVIDIGSTGISDDEISFIFQAVQRSDNESSVNKFIHEFDDSINVFKFIGEKPQCKSNGIYRDLTEFGDGLRSYISIICSLYACERGYLFIDEIGNGIYYEHFDRLWEIILKLSKEMNCQVFATTHSKEILESFTRVAKKLEEEDISYTLLLKNKEQELKTISYDYEMLEYSMLQEHEVR